MRGLDRESSDLAVAKFRYLQRHLRKKVRKFQRRVDPLIKRINRAIERLAS